MSYLIKGAIALALTVLCTYVIRGYKAYIKKRLCELSDILILAGLIRRGVSTRLLTPRECLSSSPELESDGVRELLSYVIAGQTLCDSLARVRRRLSLSSESMGLISEYFSSFGCGYREDELRLADAFIGSLSERLSLEREEAEKDKRVFSGVAISITLGIIILII